VKIYHSLRFLFITFFSAFIIAISVISAVTGINQLSSAVIDTFTDQGLQIVEKAASFVDGDAFEKLTISLNENDPFYEETRLRLFQLKENSGCFYLYTMAPKKDNIWRFIIDGSAEPDDEEHFSHLGEEEDTSEYDIAFRKAYENGITAASKLVYHEGWGWLISIYTPIRNSKGVIVGIAACDFDGHHLHDAITASEKKQLIFGGIYLCFGLLLLLFFMRKIFSPLKEMNLILKEISLGDGDLTKRIDIKNKNEMGELASDFNMTLDKIKLLIINIKNETFILADTGNDLSSNMSETAAAINEIVGNINTIQDRVISQSASVNETQATMEQVVSNINRLNKHIENQSANITSASSAIQQMVHNTRSVAERLIKNAENVQNLKNASEEGRGGLQTVLSDIQEIARESEGILNINAVMENISSQTNLLSMNAAIEAAHAGEAGKGFAVVAGEIRKLAESSSQQSKIIGDVLKKIKNAIDKIKRSTDNVLEKFEAIDSSVQVVAEQEEEVRSSMEEQQSGSKLILDGISKINEITVQVENGSHEMREGAKEVIDESVNLASVNQEITGSMKEMASGAEQITQVIGHVKRISDKNRDNIAAVGNEVSRFKVD